MVTRVLLISGTLCQAFGVGIISFQIAELERIFGYPSWLQASANDAFNRLRKPWEKLRHILHKPTLIALSGRAQSGGWGSLTLQPSIGPARSLDDLIDQMNSALDVFYRQLQEHKETIQDQLQREKQARKAIEERIDTLDSRV